MNCLQTTRRHIPAETKLRSHRSEKPQILTTLNTSLTTSEFRTVAISATEVSQRFIKKLKEDLLPPPHHPSRVYSSLFISYHHATTETIGLAYKHRTFQLQRIVEMSAMGKRSHNAARKFTCKKSYSGSLHAHKANRERGCKRISKKRRTVAN